MRDLHVSRIPAAVLLFVLLSVGAAGAQTVVSNPTTLEFAASADHARVLADGRPMVDHYNFDVYSVGAAQPFQTSSIGKPSPAADGLIRHNFSSSVTAWPFPGGTYEARVVAVGPGGSAASTVSNPFTFDSCTYALSGASATLPAAGGGTQVGVVTAAGCAWTAVANASWVALSPTTGSGNGTVVATVAANTGTGSRTATLTVAGQPFTINQQGAGTAASQPSSPSPASGTNNVSTTPTLTWTASGATSYTVRFGTTNPPAQVATGLTSPSYRPGTLSLATTYYWQVVAVSGTGSTAGPVWSFTTARHGKKK